MYFVVLLRICGDRRGLSRAAGTQRLSLTAETYFFERQRSPETNTLTATGVTKCQCRLDQDLDIAINCDKSIVWFPKIRDS
jgi:hypothetical protein